MKLGFIGLGDQGGAMAEMLLKASLPLYIWTRRATASEPFRAQGARVARDPSELASQVDLLSVCVTNDEDVEQVVFERGTLDAMPRGSILALHSTIRPELCERIARAGAARGIDVLDAPVSGSGAAARNRSLLMMVGGEPQALERARTAFEAYANPIVHMGAAGSGMRAKLIHNLVAATHIGIAVRALEASRALRLDPNHMRQAMLAGTARSFGIDAVARLQVPERAKHIVPLLRKDVQLAHDNGLGQPLHEFFALASAALTQLDAWSQGEPNLVEQVKT